MGGLIEALQRLQTVELELSRLRRTEERKNQTIRVAERQARRIEEELEELQTDCSARQREIDQLDREVKAREQSVLKHREELLKARTNKDYSAILTAINVEKADSAKVEKLALDKMSEMEQLQEQVDARTKTLEEIRKKIEVTQASLQKYRDETADRRNKLLGDREKATDALPATTLATFNRVAQRHEGEALAEVIRLHPKREEYACGGCNMQIPLDHVNAARLRDEIKLCPSCGRILYAPEPANSGA